MKNVLQLLLMISLTAIGQEYEDYIEVFEDVNGVIDLILKMTQNTIHSVTKHTLKKFHQIFYPQEDLQQVFNKLNNIQVYRKTDDFLEHLGKLLECPNWQTVQGKITKENVLLNKWIKTLKVSSLKLESEIINIKNSIDRLVMNGSANFTEKCKFFINDEVLLCLENATEEVKDISDSLLERLSNSLTNFRLSMCSVIYNFNFVKT